MGRRSRHQSRPDWYYRVMHWELDYPDDDAPSDIFDEDLSELSESEEQEGPACTCDTNASECECNSDTSDCECGLDLDPPESEVSYADSSEEYFRGIKDRRHRRKIELREEEREHEQAVEAAVKYEKERALKVREKIDALKKPKAEADKVLLRSLAGHRFDLSCGLYSEMMQRDEVSDGEYLYFEEVYDTEHKKGGEQQEESEAPKFTAILYLNDDEACSFEPFSGPNHAGEMTLYTAGAASRQVRIIFHDNDYLTIYVPADTAQCSEGASEPPFSFDGVLRSPERSREIRAELRRLEQEAAARQRSPSPRESWFELNHPMGHYYTGGWRGPW